MILALVVVTILFGVCLLLHYEALRLLSLLVPKLTNMVPRRRILVVMVGICAAHTVEIWIFALAYYALDGQFGLGSFQAQIPLVKDFAEYVYFSTVAYTSLGLGDIYPTGGMRLLTGAEALCGLLMIGWSVTFAYLLMVELWPLHSHRKH